MKLSHQLSSNISLEEFLELPETKPYNEFIDGKIYQRPMPQGEQSSIKSFLVTNINKIGQPQKLAYAFPELRCTFSGRSVISPRYCCF